MASLHKTYFLAPSWNIAPDEVVIGSVIANPKLPQNTISSGNWTADMDPSSVRRTKERSCSGTAKNGKKWSVGLFCNFMSSASGGEASYSRGSALQVDYACDVMETRRFVPTESDIASIVGESNVANYLKMGGLGARVFIITGIKTASNITITTTEENSNETVGRVGVDIPATGISVGPKGSYSPNTSGTHTRTIEGPIVFAFEIEKVKLNLRRRVVHEGFIQGAMLGKNEDAATDYVIERAGSSLDEEEMIDFELTACAEVDDGTGEAYEIILPSE